MSSHTDALTVKRNNLIEGLSKALKTRSNTKQLRSSICNIRRQAFSSEITTKGNVNCKQFPPRKDLEVPCSTDLVSNSSSGLGPITPRGNLATLDIEATYLNAVYYGLAAMAFPNDEGSCLTRRHHYYKSAISNIAAIYQQLTSTGAKLNEEIHQALNDIIRSQSLQPSAQLPFEFLVDNLQNTALMQYLSPGLEKAISELQINSSTAINKVQPIQRKSNQSKSIVEQLPLSSACDQISRSLKSRLQASPYGQKVFPNQILMKVEPFSSLRQNLSNVSLSEHCNNANPYIPTQASVPASSLRSCNHVVQRNRNTKQSYRKAPKRHSPSTSFLEKSFHWVDSALTSSTPPDSSVSSNYIPTTIPAFSVELNESSSGIGSPKSIAKPFGAFLKHLETLYSVEHDEFPYMDNNNPYCLHPEEDHPDSFGILELEPFSSKELLDPLCSQIVQRELNSNIVSSQKKKNEDEKETIHHENDLVSLDTTLISIDPEMDVIMGVFSGTAPCITPCNTQHETVSIDTKAPDSFITPECRSVWPFAETTPSTAHTVHKFDNTLDWEEMKITEKKSATTNEKTPETASEKRANKAPHPIPPLRLSKMSDQSQNSCVGFDNKTTSNANEKEEICSNVIENGSSESADSPSNGWPSANYSNDDGDIIAPFANPSLDSIHKEHFESLANFHTNIQPVEHFECHAEQVDEETVEDQLSNQIDSRSWSMRCEISDIATISVDRESCNEKDSTEVVLFCHTSSENSSSTERHTAKNFLIHKQSDVLPEHRNVPSLNDINSGISQTTSHDMASEEQKMFSAEEDTCDIEISAMKIDHESRHFDNMEAESYTINKLKETVQRKATEICSTDSAGLQNLDTIQHDEKEGADDSVRMCNRIALDAEKSFGIMDYACKEINKFETPIKKLIRTPNEQKNLTESQSESNGSIKQNSSLQTNRNPNDEKFYQKEKLVSINDIALNQSKESKIQVTKITPNGANPDLYILSSSKKSEHLTENSSSETKMYHSETPSQKTASTLLVSEYSVGLENKNYNGTQSSQHESSIHSDHFSLPLSPQMSINVPLLYPQQRQAEPSYSNIETKSNSSSQICDKSYYGSLRTSIFPGYPSVFGATPPHTLKHSSLPSFQSHFGHNGCSLLGSTHIASIQTPLCHQPSVLTLQQLNDQEESVSNFSFLTRLSQIVQAFVWRQ